LYVSLINVNYTIMKKSVINILALSSVITTASYLLDSDPTEPNVFMRFVEYIFMLTIFFTVISGFYFGIKAVTKRLQIAK